MGAGASGSTPLITGSCLLWRSWLRRVTVVASSYPGAQPEERIGDLTIHRMGGRGTVFPRAIWKLRRGLVPDADVVLEVINGITFLTPLWLRLPEFRNLIVGFETAHIGHGGEGALYVRVKRGR